MIYQSFTQQNGLERKPGTACVWVMLFVCFFGTSGGHLHGGDSVALTKTGSHAISGESLLANIKTLSSDEFEGRAPGTKGETVTVEFLTRQFKAMGLQSGNPNGTFTQEVPMVGITCIPSVTAKIQDRDLPLDFPKDCVVWTKRFSEKISVKDSEMIFVGYGIVAPEYSWDDYKGLDVRGKTLVMLIGDPPIPSAKDSSQLDPKMFKGRAMTYYGRWTYKYEIAAEKGAAAAIIIHETGPAGYPWDVVIGSNSRENFDLDTPDKNASRIPVEGWINRQKAETLISSTGKNYADLKQKALDRDFAPIPLNAQLSVTMNLKTRQVSSKNVAAVVPGRDPILKNECLIYTAHWDHLGKDTTLPGDQIYNGALDNASGVGGLLELARAFITLPGGPKRTVMFLAVTGEEKGLLGAKYYARKPLMLLAKTIANINMDVINVWGVTRDISFIGSGQNTLEDLLKTYASRAKRTTTEDAEPEKGRYFRSDHFEFAKMGVPALYAKTGNEFINRPPEFGLKIMQDYTEKDYHKVTDEVKPDWDMSGAVQDLQLLFEIGVDLSATTTRPRWNRESEFRARSILLYGQ